MSCSQFPADWFHTGSVVNAGRADDVEVHGGRERTEPPAGRSQPGELLQSRLTGQRHQGTGQDDLSEGEHHEEGDFVALARQCRIDPARQPELAVRLALVNMLHCTFIGEI